jgi:hypothetical protein
MNLSHKWQLRYLQNELFQLLKDAVGDEEAYSDAASRNTDSHTGYVKRNLSCDIKHGPTNTMTCSHVMSHEIAL